MVKLDEATRAYFYRISLAAMPILTFYGVLEENAASLWSGLVVAILNIGLAVKNTTTKTDPPEPPAVPEPEFYDDVPPPFEG
jgi:hypothetical protein